MPWRNISLQPDRQDRRVKESVAILIAAGALVLGGCTSTLMRNAANTGCERRVDSDRVRCLRNNRSSDAALAARNASERKPGTFWAAQTLKRIAAISDK